MSIPIRMRFIARKIFIRMQIIKMLKASEKAKYKQIENIKYKTKI